MADTGIAVIGAGVVGLAVAARLAPRHPDLVMLERHPRHGQETSSRNSEVIHAGIYYPQGSLKARLCVEGNRAALRAVRGATASPTGAAASSSPPPSPEELPAPGRAAAPGAPPTASRCSGSPRAEVARPGAARALGGRAPLAQHRDRQRPRADGRASSTPAREAGAVFQPRSEVVGLERGGGDYRLTVRAGGATETLHRRAGGQRRGPGGGHRGRAWPGSTWTPPATASTTARAATSRWRPAKARPRLAPGLPRARPRQPRRPRRGRAGRAGCASAPTPSTCPTAARLPGRRGASARRSAQAVRRLVPAIARRGPRAGHERHPPQAAGPGRAASATS